MKRPQLTTSLLECPYCHGDDVIVKQQGHFVNTLQLICFKCQRAANFIGPEVRPAPAASTNPEPSF